MPAENEAGSIPTQTTCNNLETSLLQRVDLRKAVHWVSWLRVVSIQNWLPVAMSMGPTSTTMKHHRLDWSWNQLASKTWLKLICWSIGKEQRHMEGTTGLESIVISKTGRSVGLSQRRLINKKRASRKHRSAVKIYQHTGTSRQTWSTTRGSLVDVDLL